MKRYLLTLTRFLKSKSAEEVEDLVQQTFLACLESAPRFRAEASFLTFLISIALNKLRAHRRSVKKLEEASSKYGDDLEHNGHLPASGEEDAKSRVLENAMAQLAPEMRRILEMHYWIGIDQVEIARSLGTPVGTVASRIRRAKDKLRMLIEAHERAQETGRAPDVSRAFASDAEQSFLRA